MNAQIETPPHRRNPDWYRVQYRLASTLTNCAFTRAEPSARKAGYSSARTEIDKLLRVCWSMLEPLPLERLLGKDKATRRFIAEIVVPAAFDLKALIELGMNDFDAGEDEEWDLKTVGRRLRRGEPVTPLTIVEAIVAAKEDPSPYLLLDLACFFQLSKDEKRAKECADKAFEKVPVAYRERLRARAAADPMLKTIPGIAGGATEEPYDHQLEEEAGDSEGPARPWV